MKLTLQSALLFLLAATASAQNTALVMDSDPGDYIGAGQNYYFTPADGAFTANESATHAVSIGFSNVTEYWSLDFAAPDSAFLQTKFYSGATRFPFQEAGEPGLSVTGDSRGCNTVTGEFEIKEIIYGPLLSFHATFVQHCKGGGPALHGEILYNSSAPLPPLNHLTSELEDFGTRNLYFEYQIRASNSPVSFTATNLPAGLSLDTSTGLISGTPSVQGTFTVHLTATGMSGKASGDLALTIDPPGQSTGRYSALYLRGDNGDYITLGQTYYLNEAEGHLSAGGSPVGSAINLYFVSFDHFDFWSAPLASPTYSRIEPTVFFDATRSASSSNPGIDISGDGRGCNDTFGEFEVKELTYAGSLVGSYHALFEQHCGDVVPALHGEAWFQSLNAITSFPGPMANRGEAFSYQIIANNKPTSWGASPLPPGLTVATNTGLITGTPTVAGRFFVPVTATGAATTAAARLDLLILPPDQNAPSITSDPEAGATVSSSFSYAVTATQSPTQYSATGLPTGVTINPGTGLISGTPSAVGTFHALIYATNASGTGGSSLTLSVFPPLPVVTSASKASVYVGRLFEFQVTASNQPASYNASGLPDGLTIGSATGLISGTPSIEGVYLVTVRAVNGSGVAFKTLTLTVAPAPPLIEGPTTAIGALDKNFSYLIVADGLPTSFGATGLPPGLAVDKSNGLITGRPTKIGVYNVTITASNSNGTGSATLTITIREETNQLLNISTRLSVQTDDNVLIGGFIIAGSYPKKVIVRGIGPSLSSAGVSGVLADPVLELYDAAGNVLASNDNWADTQETEIIDSSIPPSNPLEAAIVAILPAGSAYTAILRGQNGGEGIGLVEVYDLDAEADSQMANISTRGVVGTNDDVMVGGFIVGGITGDGNVIVRAIGPSLANNGLTGFLQDPTVELHNAQGDITASNDNWKDTQQTEIEATGVPPTDDREAAILALLAAGPYTAVVRGVEGGTGLALVEVYRIP